MVSFDGTWMKRGYKSKYSIAFVIEYYIGLVIDWYIEHVMNVMLWIYNKYIFLYIAEMCCPQECW